MIKFNKAAIAALILAAAPIALATGASAQVATGVASANYEGAVKSTRAYKAAMQQIEATYKAQIDQYETRGQILQSELNTLILKYQADEKANANNPTLKTQAQAIQTKRQAAATELNQIGLPVARARAFVDEQFESKLEPAVRAAMRKKGVGIILDPKVIIAFDKGNDLTADITSELDLTVPTVSTAVPANWQPGQKAGAAPAAGPAPAVAPRPGTQPKPATPQGR